MKVQFTSALFAFIFSYVLAGCANEYHKGGTVPQNRYASAIEAARKDKRYFMMYSGSNIYTVNSVEIDKSKKQFTVQLDKPDSLHQTSVNNPSAETPASAGSAAKAEIRIYMKDSTSYTLDEPHTIPLDKVGRVELKP